MIFWSEEYDRFGWWLPAQMWKPGFQSTPNDIFSSTYNGFGCLKHLQWFWVWARGSVSRWMESSLFYGFISTFSVCCLMAGMFIVHVNYFHWTLEAEWMKFLRVRRMNLELAWPCFWSSSALFIPSWPLLLNPQYSYFLLLSTMLAPQYCIS